MSNDRPGARTGKPNAGSPRLLLWATILSGAAVILGSVIAIHLSGEWVRLLLFMPLAIGAELMNVQVFESGKQRISLSFSIAVTMAAVVTAPLIAPLVSLTAAGLHIAMLKKRQWDKVLYNLANPAVAAMVACGFADLVSEYLHDQYLIRSLLATLAFYVTNTGNITMMVSLYTRRQFQEVLRESAWFGPTNLMLGLTGAYLAQAYGQFGLTGLIIFLVPLLILRSTLVLYARRSQQTIAALQAAMAETERAQRDREETLRSLIETVSSIIDARDHAVHGHSGRVAAYAVALGKQLKLPAAELAEIHTAGLLHDVGKIAIPEVILNKPSRLTDEEFAIMKTHAATGQQILSEVQPLERVARMVGEHHERWDGGGYPAGKESTGICLGGRLLAVADALDCILSDRPYSRGKGLDWALGEINRCAGSHFDSDVVAALNRLVEQEGPRFFMGDATGRVAAVAVANQAPAGSPG